MKHHAALKLVAKKHHQDVKTEWWTVTNEDALHDMRQYIPFENLFCHMQEGGFVVYLDKPRSELKEAHELIALLQHQLAQYREREKTMGWNQV